MENNLVKDCLLIPILTTEEKEEAIKFINKFPNSQILITHSSVFHCDETFASVLIRYIKGFDSPIIIRTRNKEIIEMGKIVYDVGNEYNAEKLRFDHHMKTFAQTFSETHEIKLSSAGLIYKHFGKEIITSILHKKLNICDSLTLDYTFDHIYNGFVAAIDAADNGVNQYPKDIKPKYTINTSLSTRIKNLNPSWNEVNITTDERFREAMITIEKEFLDNIKKYATNLFPCFSIVEKAYKNRYTFHPSGNIMFMEKGCPFNDHLRNLEEKEKEEFLKKKKEVEEKGNNIKNIISNQEEFKEIYFVLIPSDDKKDIQIKCIDEGGSYVLKKPLPQKLRGLSGDQLKKVSGFEDAIMVHSSGFLGKFGKIESCIKICEMAMTEANGNNEENLFEIKNQLVKNKEECGQIPYYSKKDGAITFENRYYIVLDYKNTIKLGNKYRSMLTLAFTLKNQNNNILKRIIAFFEGKSFEHLPRIFTLGTIIKISNAEVQEIKGKIMLIISSSHNSHAKNFNNEPKVFSIYNTKIEKKENKNENENENENINININLNEKDEELATIKKFSESYLSQTDLFYGRYKYAKFSFNSLNNIFMAMIFKVNKIGEGNQNQILLKICDSIKIYKLICNFNFNFNKDFLDSFNPGSIVLIRNCILDEYTQNLMPGLDFSILLVPEFSNSYKEFLNFIVNSTNSIILFQYRIYVNCLESYKLTMSYSTKKILSLAEIISSSPIGKTSHPCLFNIEISPIDIISDTKKDKDFSQMKENYIVFTIECKDLFNFDDDNNYKIKVQLSEAKKLFKALPSVQNDEFILQFNLFKKIALKTNCRLVLSVTWSNSDLYLKADDIE